MLKLTIQLALVILFVLFIAKNSKAEIFIVNSNADAGVGTLRDALIKAAANGISDKDYIHFNIVDQSETGRTITLLSQLPNVSSNLDIDGSTQSGNVFGRSTAKVKLIPSFTILNSYYYGLSLDNVVDVGIYGLYIKNERMFDYSSGIIFELMSGISLKAAKNIKIGDVGKGNVICGFHRDLASNVRIGNGLDTFVENLSVKANFIGLEADGTTIPPKTNMLQTFNAYMFNIYGVVDIGDGTIGGQNVIAKGIYINQMNLGQYPEPLHSMPAFLNFRFNIFGNNLDLNSTESGNSGISIGSSSPNTLSTVKIYDNVLAGGYGIQIVGNKNPVEIKRNFIGVDRNLNKSSTINTGIFVYYVDNVQIGGNNPADANYIGYCKPINVWTYTSASINKNSFFCTKDAYPMILDSYGTRPFPKVEITSASASSIIGKATPNSQIELFYSDLCGTCSPEVYFASTVADANGNWEYTGTILRSVIASATLNGITSEFTRTRVDVSGIKITNTCANTGSITGALPLSATYVEWLNVNGDIVGRGRDLLNMPIGVYRLKAINGDCSEVTPWFEIKKSLIISTNNVQITNAACGVGGSIRGLQVVNNTSSATVYSWKNELGVEVATTQNLTNAVPGKYTLAIRTADNNCIETYGPVTLVTTSGPQINLSAIVITPANCSTNSGAINGIVVNGTGILSYRWKNANNIQVGTTKDLTSQPPGTYTLEVTDQSSCGAVSTTPITIQDANAITISDSQKQVFNPTCVGNNGSVKGLQITGATSYIWKNSSGQTVGVKADLEEMTTGTYQLTASNSSCSKTYDVTLVVQPNLINYSGVTKTLADATCALNNGRITIILQNPVHLPKSYRWVDQLGKTVGGNSTTLANIDAGTYSVYGSDDNNCEIFLASYTINRQTVLSLNSENYKIVNDNCNQGFGSIKGLKVSEGLAPYTYRWTNEAGVVVGNSLEVTNLPKGKYTLRVTDALNCVPLFSDFTIDNSNQVVAAPTAVPIQLCAPGEAMLNVRGAGNATSYVLYLSEDSMIPFEVNKNGVFKVDIKNDRSYFIAQRIGDCESQRVEVTATVGLSGLTIANTITPNNDGINDVWNLKGIENYPKAQVQIFNRLGNKVHESVGYKTVFNGTYNGKTLQTGVYYYVIKLGPTCEIIKGTLTLIL